MIKNLITRNTNESIYNHVGFAIADGFKKLKFRIWECRQQEGVLPYSTDTDFSYLDISICQNRYQTYKYEINTARKSAGSRKVYSKEIGF